MTSKSKEEKAEIEANRLLDEFIEAYNELHQHIHHREKIFENKQVAKQEQDKLKADFADVFYKDLEVNKRLGKFVEFVNNEAEEDGNES